MMKLKILTITFSFGLLSCNNKTESTLNNENVKVDAITVDTTLKAEQHTIVISDTIKRFAVDDYPLSNKMLADKTNNNSFYKKQSGQTYSFDKVWFSNDTLEQTIVFELYTDYHRMVIYHFYSNDIPFDLINRMDLHSENGELALEKQKIKDFNGFLNQTTKINASYFTTEKGFKLGDIKQKAIDIYGKPDKQSKNEGIEKLEWEFIGAILYDGKPDLKGKPIAKDSFGHQIVMYFKNEKLIGHVLFNDIP